MSMSTTDYYEAVADRLAAQGRREEAIRAYDAAECHLPTNLPTIERRKEIMAKRLQLLEAISS